MSAEQPRCSMRALSRRRLVEDFRWDGFGCINTEFPQIFKEFLILLDLREIPDNCRRASEFSKLFLKKYFEKCCQHWQKKKGSQTEVWDRFFLGSLARYDGESTLGLFLVSEGQVGRRSFSALPVRAAAGSGELTRSLCLAYLSQDRGCANLLASSSLKANCTLTLSEFVQ